MVILKNKVDTRCVLLFNSQQEIFAELEVIKSAIYEIIGSVTQWIEYFKELSKERKKYLENNRFNLLVVFNNVYINRHVNQISEQLAASTIQLEDYKIKLNKIKKQIETIQRLENFTETTKDASIKKTLSLDKPDVSENLDKIEEVTNELLLDKLTQLELICIQSIQSIQLHFPIYITKPLNIL